MNAASTAAAEHHELFSDNTNGPRRSCSITLAYPSDSILLTTKDPDGQTPKSASSAAMARATLDRQKSADAARRDGIGSALFCSGRLVVAPSVADSRRRTTVDVLRLSSLCVLRQVDCTDLATPPPPLLLLLLPPPLVLLLLLLLFYHHHRSHRLL